MAEKVGFEPTRRYSRPTRFPGEPLQPLGYFSKGIIFMKVMKKIKAERVGFEPTAPCGVTGFQDQLLKPLGHLSIDYLALLRLKEILSDCFNFVNIFFYKKSFIFLCLFTFLSISSTETSYII